jgi:4-hydroxybenzoate polyprenyltransferase
MPAIKVYLALFRVSNLPTVWSNVLTALLLCGETFSWTSALVLLISLSLIYCGGMALNDICDLEIDIQKRSSRPIPSGMITSALAKRVTVLLFISAFSILCALPHATAAATATCVLVGLIVLYDRYHKGNPLSVLLMAGCRFMVYMVSVVGMTGRVTIPVFLVALCQFSYIILLSGMARYENRLPRGFSFPLIPLLLAGICLVDGISAALFLRSPLWLAVGVGGFLMTLAGQKFVRGD